MLGGTIHNIPSRSLKRPHRAISEPEELEEGEIPEPRKRQKSPLRTHLLSFATSTPSSIRRSRRRSAKCKASQRRASIPLCATYCTTGLNHSSIRNHRKILICPGSCSTNCPLTHNPTKTAICPTMLEGTSCLNGKCQLSHVWRYEVVPSCARFLMGFCPDKNCRYAHCLGVNFASPRCEEFARVGFCEAGEKCGRVHWLNTANNESAGDSYAGFDENIEFGGKGLKTHLFKSSDSGYTSGRGSSDDTASIGMVSVQNPDASDEARVDVVADEAEFVRGKGEMDVAALQADFIPLW